MGRVGKVSCAIHGHSATYDTPHYEVYAKSGDISHSSTMYNNRINNYIVHFLYGVLHAHFGHYEKRYVIMGADTVFDVLARGKITAIASPLRSPPLS